MSTPEGPEPTDKEQEAPPERLREEESQRGPGHDDPDEARSPDE